ncbi:MAG: F0F1 ATP synthase subunit B [Solirubrobacteraceae bacterium]|jgi:F-type H+-transporting ATPase subunit b
MTPLTALTHTPIASSGSWLITPNVGLMIWTFVVFGAAFIILRKYVFPPIAKVLDDRQHAIDESMDAQERLRVEAEKVLAEYRARLEEARTQAEEILAHARRTGEEHERETIEAARKRRNELLDQTRRDIEDETRRAIGEIRKEVANLTIIATEKVTRKALDSADQRRLVEEALGELDFTTLQGSKN